MEQRKTDRPEAPLKLKLREVWAIRIRLQLSGKTRHLVLFNLAIDSKLRACDLMRLLVSDICLDSHVAALATVMQQNRGIAEPIATYPSGEEDWHDVGKSVNGDCPVMESGFRCLST